MKEILLVWKYSLGSFSDSKTEKYDNWIALVRTVIFVSYMVTNSFIVAGVIRHWGVKPPEVPQHRDANRTVSVDTEHIKK